MQVSALTPSQQAAFGSQNATSVSQVAQKQLGSQDFLKLLVTQMTTQDPLNPMDDKEFIAQMAQFSSLEETTKLNKTMSAFVQGQQAAAASSYLGREVTLAADGAEIRGIVSAVSASAADGQVSLTVNGRRYDVSSVREIRLPQQQA